MSYPGLLHPEPLLLQQSTADLYLSGDTQTQYYLSLCGVLDPGAYKICLNPLAGVQFASEGDFAPPTILLGLILCPWPWIISSKVTQLPLQHGTAVSPMPTV